jgi:membrane fusion protein, copper/silver efflux system
MTDQHLPLPEGAEPPPAGVALMGVVRWGLVAFMALAAVIAVVDYVRATRLQPATTATAGTQYYCPMHPAVVQDHPGECPICSMTLVRREPVDAQHAAAPETSNVPGLVTVALPAERVQRIGLRTAVARQAMTEGTIRTVGYVTAGEDRVAKVHARFSGWIERVSANQTGKSVRKGDVLATIYSPELVTAQQEYLNARRWARDDGVLPHLTKGLAADARHRLGLLGIATEEIAQLDRSGQVATALPLRSPVDGIVTAKTALPGAYVEPAMELFEVADLSAVWVLADVYERDLARVRAGLGAELTLTAWPGQTWTGRVDFVPPTVSTDSRTARVRLVFANPKGQLRPGSYGDLVLDLPATASLLVPAEAVVDTGSQQYVFIAHADGR